MICNEAMLEMKTIHQHIRADEMTKTSKKRLFILSHMEGVKRKRGRMLHDVMVRVIDEQSISYTKQLAVQCLRRLRIHSVSANSEQIFRRARLKNWIQICKRLRRLDRSMQRQQF